MLMLLRILTLTLTLTLASILPFDSVASSSSSSSSSSSCPCSNDESNHDSEPLSVYLLDGQSNMVGMGSLVHLKLLLDDDATHAEYAHLWNETDWKENDRVYIKFDDQMGRLKAGRGAAGPDRGGHIGPELEFGWYLGDHGKGNSNNNSNNNDKNDAKVACPCHRSKKPILVLKAAYGGRDLAIDFRPPTAGIGNYSSVAPMHYGWEYREMITTIQSTLADNDLLSKIVPTYNATRGYKIDGMVWFQGWNDMLDWAKVKEYEYLLKELIVSMRLDLDVPDMPVVIGELGMHGPHPTGRGADRVAAMRQAERNVVSKYFPQSSVFVPTAKYMVMNGTTYNGQFHYNGRADTYCHIGKAFGKAMQTLIARDRTMKDQQPEHTSSSASNDSTNDNSVQQESFFWKYLRGSWSLMER